MTYRPNWDALALRALLDNDQEELTRIDMLARCATGTRCPECSGADIDGNSNGTAFICLGCEHQWDGADIEV